ncbi:MAG: chloride channel protein [Desulfobacteraceae bacterium]|nr:MAG: chloride channel protein [Desulfobacteraceae bacterium]
MRSTALFKAARYKWAFVRSDDRMLLIVLAAFVGACSGLAAVALNRTLHFMAASFQNIHQHWWGFFLPAVGASLSAVFLNTLLKERAGHGVPEVVYAVSRHGGLLRFRSSYSRLIASSLTIGSGGSAGPEAPVVMSGAALGANIAKFFGLKERQRVILVGCGAAGAIASIFNAPITGLVFTVEAILGEWRAFNIIPVAIAAVAGTEISRWLQGNQIVFAHPRFTIGWVDTAASFGLVLFVTAASLALGRLLKGMHQTARGTPLPAWLRPAVGGAAVGLIGFSLPFVLGEGYHSIQQMIRGTFTPGLALAAMAVAAKMAATCLTLGWGGSGGIFAPSLMIGSLVGLLYHRLLTAFLPTQALSDEGCFALLGMAGLVAGMLQAPLTAIFLVVEITGGYEVILPLIIVAALTSTFCYYFEPGSFYLRELIEKGQYLRPGTDARVLSDLTVAELVETGYIKVPGDMLLADFMKILQRSQRYLFPVEDRASGRYLGVVFVDRIRPYLFDPQVHSVVMVEQVMETVPVVRPDDELLDVLNLMDREGLSALPVVEDHRFVGMLSKATLLDHYRKELIVQTGI